MALYLRYRARVNIHQPFVLDLKALLIARNPTKIRVIATPALNTVTIGVCMLVIASVMVVVNAVMISVIYSYSFHKIIKTAA